MCNQIRLFGRWERERGACRTNIYVFIYGTMTWVWILWPVLAATTLGLLFSRISGTESEREACKVNGLFCINTRVIKHNNSLTKPAQKSHFLSASVRVCIYLFIFRVTWEKREWGVLGEYTALYIHARVTWLPTGPQLAPPSQSLVFPRLSSFLKGGVGSHKRNDFYTLAFFPRLKD